MTDQYFYFSELRNALEQERKIILEIVALFQAMENEYSESEEVLINNQIELLSQSLKNVNNSIPGIMEGIAIIKRLPVQREVEEKTVERKSVKRVLAEMTDFEKETLKRLKKGVEKKEEKKERKASYFVSLSNQIFSKISMPLSEKKIFRTLKRDLVRANLQFLAPSYISVSLMAVLISFIVSIFIELFFMFFRISAQLPIITRVTEGFLLRFIQTFWIMLAIPIVMAMFMYFYPSMERSSRASRIEDELPFATIHMSAISGSMLEPSKIFNIIIATGEYPYLEKEFIKLVNEINIYGYDLVSALRDCASKSPSKRLSELYNGLATTINSGGDLRAFFDKRSQSLLFEYRLEREKYARTAETFMDIYISVVIAAPMVLMLLLMMIKISGLGLSLSTSTLTLIMVLAVALVNFLFIVFLSLKQPSV